jgi:hypothetical protein
MAGGPPLTIFACTIPTEGAPSLRFLQEPALSAVEGTGHPSVLVMPSEIKSLGHPPGPRWRLQSQRLERRRCARTILDYRRGRNDHQRLGETRTSLSR